MPSYTYRTVDEAKLLEIALAARTGDQTVREAKLQEIETAFCLDAECGDACTSRIDCVVSILPITVEQHAEECADTDEVPSEGKRPSTANRTTTGKSRATVPSQVNQDQLLAQAVEERALLARIWRRLTHYLQVFSLDICALVTRLQLICCGNRLTQAKCKLM